VLGRPKAGLALEKTSKNLVLLSSVDPILTMAEGGKTTIKTVRYVR
jgi:hypothetical protein